MWTINRDLFTRSAKRRMHKVAASLFAWVFFLLAMVAGGYIGATLWKAWKPLGA